ncbi:hypothetical protein CONLIGDRAFT_645895 [Coniochaeta ligniaria NRRL 30616]|uniref:Uncharacterized protein n=1 Tax=Coniochaeta ligniaria NRRL 30616 TaxID=1408157 RepID=A0A1J7IJI8_9PEZI|nr:hypothetical protein CONLIGDRAFT_645895 [Coniochaeta ligniaria NRRL 30616]
MAQKSTTGGQASPSGSRFEALCQLYPYSRCPYTKKIVNEDEAAKAEWGEHIRSHYHEEPELLPDSLYCWLKACPRSQGGFYADPNDTDALERNFESLLDHMLEHFRNEPQLSRDHLRDDDAWPVVIAWHEIWDAYHNPQIPGKNTEKLSSLTFDKLGKILEESQHSSKRRDLISLTRVKE